MDMTTILPLEAVRSLSNIASKKRLLQDLSEQSEGVYGFPQREVYEAMQERELLGSTAMGHGVAVPHVRLSCITKVCGLFIRLEKPVEFDTLHKQPVDLVFALFAPAEAKTEHLKALALVSRTLRDERLAGKLRANSDPASLHAILTDQTGSKAA